MKKIKLAKAVATAAIAGAALVALVGCGGGSQSVKIGVPSDPTNEARALLLLQDEGLLALEDGAGLQATKNDIADNPHNIEIVEMEAASLPTSLPDLDMAVINGNYAIGLPSRRPTPRPPTSTRTSSRAARAMRARPRSRRSWLPCPPRPSRTTSTPPTTAAS